jgi:hypothetical protein
MTVKELDCLPGTSIYLTEFGAALHTQFPHHGGPRFSEDHGYLYCRRIRAHVCSQCAKLFDEWHEKHRR